MLGGRGLDRTPESRFAGGYGLTELVGQARWGGAAGEQQGEQQRGDEQRHGQGARPQPRRDGC
ncbi:hypothetical protein D3C81_1432450 [compost metagenome]